MEVRKDYRLRREVISILKGEGGSFGTKREGGVKSYGSYRVTVFHKHVSI